MGSSRNEIEDPNLADLPDEAFNEIDPETGPTLPQLEARIRARREQGAQDAGWVESPHLSADIEPLPDVEEQPPSPEDPEEPTEQEEPTDTDEEAEGGEQTGEEDDGDFYVGRYKTKEAAEEALAEKDKTIVQLFREKHERERATQQQQQQQGTEPVLDRNTWSEWAQTAVEEGQGIQGAMAALERGGPEGYDIYIAHWLEDEDPASRIEARAFDNAVQREFAAAAARSGVQQVQQPEPASQNGNASDATIEAMLAKNALAERYKDFSDHEEAMDKLVTDPGALDDRTKSWLATQAQNGVEGKERAWEYLYLRASRERVPERSRAQRDEQKRRKASADAAKVDAVVSSSEGTSVRTPRSEAELAEIRKRNGIRKSAGIPLLPED
jgi:hypothetical protein